MTPTCKIEGCAKPVRTMGACNMHYLRFQKHGTYELVGRMAPLEVRLWAKVNKTETCWLWTGGDNGNGYGQIGLRNEKVYVHRLSWELANGPIPDGLTIDHLCMVTRCVNPDHLEAVPCGVNVSRGYAGAILSAKHRATTHCPQGHPYAGDNLKIDHRGARLCRTCRLASDAASKRRRKIRDSRCLHPYCRATSPADSHYCEAHQAP